MSETRATAPAFPPGRYGRRRDGRRRIVLPTLFAVLVLVASTGVAVRLYTQYGDPDYDARIVGWTDVTDTGLTVQFTVRVPPGAATTCMLRARSYDGAEVGRGTVTVRPEGDSRTVSASAPVSTTSRAAVGEVLRCRPAA